jgi:Fe-S-cluster containining protein
MEHICETCHKSGKGCCIFRGSVTSEQIGIFQNDITMIENHLGIMGSEFIIKETVNKNFIETLSQTVHPIFTKIYHNNISFRLKTINSRCIFLGENGCSLPLEARPLYCRIYPFFPSKDFLNIIVLSSYDCKAQNQSTLSWEIVNKHFGYKKEYLMELFELFREYSERHNESSAVYYDT